jgi:glycosyltransferase involved in cell wall biosynthesis
LQVSVIMTTYNRASTVARAIKSLKNQTYCNIQIVVIDGNSTDNTLSIIKPMLNDKDILLSEPDKGIYDALNKGLALAKGDIIAFLHSDDLYYDDNIISTVVDAFSNVDVDVVYGDVLFFSGKNVDKPVRKYRSDKLLKKNLAWGKMPAHPAMFIKRKVYEKIGYFETDFMIAADYEFMCRLVNYINLKSVYLPYMFVRMQLGGISTGGFKNTILLNKEVLRALYKNNIYSNIFMLLSKYPLKILQFFIT